ncbi:MAG: hypothetical protein CVU66_00415 [Deltaproteobacteria bacterium HGW-Deltaproteobacteria-23]|nr:MAG: hypothetical protein CVU66_00415 [Deltaproteobacteria bacterium HGW-Deltaproteobacteria-23]
MKPRIITMAAVMGLIVALSAGELLAAGQGSGGGKGMQMRTKTQTRTQSAVAGTAVTRPADSQRRDGTFLTTGVTANGSTTRPGNGKGLQDGSRLNTSTAPVTAQ